MKKPTRKRKPKLPRVPIPKPTQVIPNKKKKKARERNWAVKMDGIW